MLFYSIPNQQVSSCLNIGLPNGCVTIGLQSLPLKKAEVGLLITEGRHSCLGNQTKQGLLYFAWRISQSHCMLPCESLWRHSSLDGVCSLSHFSFPW